jgi:hypothetical protein
MRNLKTRIGDYVKAVTAVASGRVIAGRRLTVYPDDVFIVSYPKSGNTWTRFLIGNLVHHEPVTFANVETLVPSIYVHPDRVLRRLPRILKSHECFDPRYRKVIYIARDPRDVAVSYYHHCIKMRWLSDQCSLDEFVPRFMQPEFEINFGTWSDHLLSWLGTRRDSENFLFIRYEDLIDNPQAELARVAALLKIDAGQERLQRAVNLSSADRMRDLEKQQGDQWALIKESRKDKSFVRSAKSGGWRTVLSAQSVAKIEAAWGPLMESVGYELSASEMQQAAIKST